MNVKNVTIRCDDNAEALVFSKYKYHDNEFGYEISVEDSYCRGTCVGIIGRFQRAWHAFWAKPICYSGVYIGDKERVRNFLNDCLELLND